MNVTVSRDLLNSHATFWWWGGWRVVSGLSWLRWSWQLNIISESWERRDLQTKLSGWNILLNNLKMRLGGCSVIKAWPRFICNHCDHHPTHPAATSSYRSQRTHWLGLGFQTKSVESLRKFENQARKKVLQNHLSRKKWIRNVGNNPQTSSTRTKERK